jgi:hypothetical protein
MINILTKIKAELNDVYGITSVNSVKKIIYVHVLNDFYKTFAQELLKEKFNNHELERVKVVVTGHDLPAID